MPHLPIFGVLKKKLEAGSGAGRRKLSEEGGGVVGMLTKDNSELQALSKHRIHFWLNALHWFHWGENIQLTSHGFHPK